VDEELSNLLYTRPELYESVYHGSGDAVPRMCERLFERHLGGYPSSLLDIGCGTGRDLAYLAKRCPDCVGVDYQEGMVAYARTRRPEIDFRTGDMRSLRLGRTFGAITSLGIAIANVHANDDVSRSVATFAAHAAPGALLILEALNALAAPGGGTLPRRFVIDAPGLSATADATYEDDVRRQLLVRTREWVVAGENPKRDFVRFRTLAPMEIEHHLAQHGFETLEMYDNRDLVANELRNSSLIVVARRG
jgi:SAM-dependent methyltransferase